MMLKADFRAFGAIGFQKMWLKRQGLEGQETLLYNIIESCARSGINVIGINTEDDRVYPAYPEDRFGFLKYR